MLLHHMEQKSRPFIWGKPPPRTHTKMASNNDSMMKIILETLNHQCILDTINLDGLKPIKSLLAALPLLFAFIKTAHNKKPNTTNIKLTGKQNSFWQKIIIEWNALICRGGLWVWINLSAVNANVNINNKVFPSYLDYPTTVIYHFSESIISLSVMRVSEVTYRIISIWARYDNISFIINIEEFRASDVHFECLFQTITNT